MAALRILAAGASTGVIKAMAPAWRRAGQPDFEARFDGIGALEAALEAAVPWDVVVTTEAVAGELAAAGVLQGRPRLLLGRVPVALAVRRGDPLPDIRNAGALLRALEAAPTIVCPHAGDAGPGAHFARTLAALGLATTLAPRLETRPDGAAALRALAGGGAAGAIGCAEASEIVSTPGLALAGPLPPPHHLATGYVAAVCSRATDRRAAEAFVALLDSEPARIVREAGGFGG